jgi:hypothetical protein
VATDPLSKEILERQEAWRIRKADGEAAQTIDCIAALRQANHQGCLDGYVTIHPTAADPVHVVADGKGLDAVRKQEPGMLEFFQWALRSTPSASTNLRLSSDRVLQTFVARAKYVKEANKAMLQAGGNWRHRHSDGAKTRLRDACSRPAFDASFRSYAEAMGSHVTEGPRTKGGKATWIASNIALTAEASRLLGEGTLKLLPSEQRGEKRKRKAEEALGKGKGMGVGEEETELQRFCKARREADEAEWQANKKKLMAEAEAAGPFGVVKA